MHGIIRHVKFGFTFDKLNDLLLALDAVINIEPTEVNLFKKGKTAYQVEIFSNLYFT